jgi:hypothetical protein
MPWSGDINTTFAFEAQVRMGLNLALSGVPHWGTDIGGFYSVAPDAGELFVRWLQFAPSVRSSAPTTMSGAAICPGRTAPRLKRSAAVI